MTEEIVRDLLVPVELAGSRIDQALASLLPDYSRSLIKGWILAGSVAVDGRVPRPSERLKGGETVQVKAAAPEPGAWLAEDIAIEVLHADADVIVVNKPAGLVVHPAVGNRSGTLVNALLYRYPDLAALPRAGVVHRLDKDTTGVMVVARSRPAHTALVKQLARRRVGREYFAIVLGRVTAGGLVAAPIGRHHVQRTRMAVIDDGRPSLTHYRVVERLFGHTRLRCRLETGRTHQIRVHMAHIGHPILGDPLYGGRPRLPAGAQPELIAALRAFRRQALHAETLTFVHPVERETLVFRAPVPTDILSLLSALRAAGPEDPS